MKMHRNIIEIVSGVIEKVLQGGVNAIEEGLNGLRIERLVDGREKQQTLAVRSISKNYT